MLSAVATSVWRQHQIQTNSTPTNGRGVTPSCFWRLDTVVLVSGSNASYIVSVWGCKVLNAGESKQGNRIMFTTNPITYPYSLRCVYKEATETLRGPSIIADTGCDLLGKLVLYCLHLQHSICYDWQESKIFRVFSISIYTTWMHI